MVTMKQIIVLFIGALLFTSCTKSFQCECYRGTDNEHVSSKEIKYKKGAADRAKDMCIYDQAGAMQESISDTSVYCTIK